jgi:hypothetical protein
MLLGEHSRGRVLHDALAPLQLSTDSQPQPICNRTSGRVFTTDLI